MKHVSTYCFCLLFGLCGCQQASQPDSDVSVSPLKYAKGFRVESLDESKRVRVLQPYPGAKQAYSYLLVPKDVSIPNHPAEDIVIRTPVERIVCTSTSHIPLLDYLGATDKLIGFPSTDYISSSAMRKRIDDGKVTDLGIDKSMNIEMLVAIHPEMVMGYTLSADLGQLRKIQELGIPVVINAEYLEQHPLGRAEWIKFVALFLDRENQADSIFNIIEANYLNTLALTRSVPSKPTVLSGIVYGDTWFMPGGENNASKLLKDAGTSYLWGDDTGSGFLELSFESVYAKAREADLWIGVGSFNTLDELASADQRYTNFLAFQSGKVFSYNNRIGAKGGNEFLELGYLRPDLILNDLVKIAHPSLLPDHELFFYRQLH